MTKVLSGVLSRLCLFLGYFFLLFTDGGGILPPVNSRLTLIQPSQLAREAQRRFSAKKESEDHAAKTLRRESEL